jgi:osmotically inducible protein OsmC
MAAFSRTATVDWEGSVRDGHGEAKAGTGAFALPVSFPRRIGDPEGSTSPEELIAAAHSACYAMALNATVGRKNGAIARTHVTCTVTAEFDAGIKIQSSKLEVVAEGLTGIEAGDFQTVAEEAEKGCPVSNALRGSLAITVVASVK